ncbi:MAG: peptidoglycan glycosyltransferase, partial [Chloroflexaceae bacterium]|nr:peptidoglycan glycosyltransferase [Chloroflexaceae bacterium]
MFRVLLLRLILVLMLIVLAGRLYQLQLVRDEAEPYDDIAVTTTRYVLVTPRRGEVFAADGTTVLAESVPTLNIAVQPGRLPLEGDPQRATVLGRLAQFAGITTTLTISPALLAARNALVEQHLAPYGFIVSMPLSTSHIISPEQTLDILRLTTIYSDVLILDNPIEERLRRTNAPGYETVVVKEDVSSVVALAVRENTSYLPGVVIEEDYERRYPQSGNAPTISHLLGYLGRINSCELVAENPSRSWVESMRDMVSNVAECGVVQKDIAANSGAPLYRHDDRIGKDGLEGGYEDELRGTIGVQMVAVDARERPVSDPRTIQPVQEGHDLILTIDLTFQQQIAAILQRWIDESERRRQQLGSYRLAAYNPITNGVAVMMDVRDGRILAMVSLPAYDNNVWVDYARTDELQNLLSPADPATYEELMRLAPLTNRAIAGRYPSGSTLKQFVGAAALQQGIIRPDTRLRDPGQIVLQERSGQLFVLPNSVPVDNGAINISDALKVSSNVFFASIGGGNNEATNLGENFTSINGLRINGLAEGLGWFGFGQPTGIRLFGESGGRVPSPYWKSHALREPWTTGDTYNTSIGQGYLETTPLQLVNAMAALANRGTLYRPQLVQSIVNSNGELVQNFQPEVIAQLPIDPVYYNVLFEGMRRSVTEGSNVAARNECSGLSIIGKTGTAEFGPNIITPEGDITRQSHFVVCWLCAPRKPGNCRGCVARRHRRP